jgi:hypothetical protein
MAGEADRQARRRDAMEILPAREPTMADEQRGQRREAGDPGPRRAAAHGGQDQQHERPGRRDDRRRARPAVVRDVGLALDERVEDRRDRERPRRDGSDGRHGAPDDPARQDGKARRRGPEREREAAPGARESQLAAADSSTSSAATWWRLVCRRRLRHEVEREGERDEDRTDLGEPPLVVLVIPRREPAGQREDHRERAEDADPRPTCAGLIRLMIQTAS